jgi:hypothetical protein
MPHPHARLMRHEVDIFPNECLKRCIHPRVTRPKPRSSGFTSYSNGLVELL